MICKRSVFNRFLREAVFVLKKNACHDILLTIVYCI